MTKESLLYIQHLRMTQLYPKYLIITIEYLGFAYMNVKRNSKHVNMILNHQLHYYIITI